MPRLVQLLWKWSWVITLPLAVFSFIWLLPTWREARQFLVYHPASLHRSSDVDLNLRQILVSRLNALQADLVSSWKSRWVNTPSPLARIDLEVSPANLAQLNEYLPRSGKETFVQGLLRYPNGNLEKVGVRYRGDSLHHWGFEAKSWLVRTNKDRPIDGQRRWHLVLPRWRSVANYYANLRMAAQMGVLAVDSKLVDLRINGRQHGGIHLLQPQEDEAFLLSHGRLSSDLYVGDMTWLDDNYVNEEQHGGLWELPWLWQKAAFDPNYPSDSHRPLEMLFFRLYHGSTPELLDLLDLPAWANFSAYMQLFAADHMEMGHNWKLLYDPGKLSFSPVVGDGNGLPDDIYDLTAKIPGRDVSITTPLLARLHQDHEFLRLKNEALSRFYREQLDRKFFTELDHLQALTAPTLKIFPQLDWMGTVDGRPVHYFDELALAQRVQTVTPKLKAWFEAQRANQALAPEKVASAIVDSHTLRVAIDGYASVKLGLRLATGSPPPSVRLLIHRADGRTESADMASRLRTAGDVTWLEWPLLAQRVITIPTTTQPHADHLVKRTTYDLILAQTETATVGVIASGPLGEEFPVSRAPQLVVAPIGDDNTGLLPPSDPTTRWQGEVNLDGLTELRGPLIIEAGTRIRLGPKASVIVRGQVTARGTSAQPVRIERQQPSAPWGTFALIGPAADHSILEQCIITGGSGLVSPYANFSGMLSIHAANNVQLRHCRLEDSAGSNDLLSAVYGSIEVSDLWCKGAARNALTLAMCPSRLQRLTIEGSGNDALDITGSDTVLTGSSLTRSRNHGIQAGGACRLVVLNSLIEANGTGLQASDGAEAVLYNVTLSDNLMPLAAGRTNLAYPGLARVTLAKSAVANAKLPFDLRENSSLTVLDSQIFGSWSDRDVSLDGLSDTSPLSQSSDPTPAFDHLLPGPYWSEANSQQRGQLKASASALPSRP